MSYYQSLGHGPLPCHREAGKSVHVVLSMVEVALPQNKGNSPSQEEGSDPG